jgi:hypothetical protein
MLIYSLPEGLHPSNAAGNITAPEPARAVFFNKLYSIHIIEF